MSEWLEIDGSQGEGGGQVLRTALTLSLVTGRPIRIVNVRAGRERPGLLRQHLTAVQAAAQISSAEVSGDEMRSRELSFRPGPVRPGAWSFHVGTAGSACLVAQTVLLPLALAGGSSELFVEGGTHNRMAPPFDFLAEAWLPLVRACGYRIEAAIDRHGFFPAGGGRIRFRIDPPAAFTPLVHEERGEIVGRLARALLSRVRPRVGERELSTVAKRTSFTPEDCRVESVDSIGPGNAIVLRVQCERATEVFTGFGEQGKLAEAVASDAIDELRAWHAADVPVGLHLADQLLLPMALAAGGRFRTMPLSMHSTTNGDVIGAFLGDVVSVEPDAGRNVRVTVRGRE